MSVSLLLPLAALCQLLLAWLCLQGVVEILFRHRSDSNPDTWMRIGLPATASVAFQALLFNVGLLVSCFPNLSSGRIPDGTLFIAGVGFGVAAVSAIAVTASVGAGSRPLMAQLLLGILGLICVFVPYSQRVG